jgi:hypothetical protein
MLMDKAVFGIYKIRREAENAVNALRTNGFGTDDISVLLPEHMGSQDQFHIKVSKAPEDAIAGASAGAVLGGTLSLLASIGSLTIPGVGPFIAAGPLLSALAGAGAGAGAGALVGVLAGYGIPETEAQKFESLMREGRVLVNVNATDEASAVKAKNILEATGAIEASISSELGEDWIPAQSKTGSQATTQFF